MWKVYKKTLIDAYDDKDATIKGIHKELDDYSKGLNKIFMEE